MHRCLQVPDIVIAIIEEAMLLPLNPGIRKRRGAKERPSSSTGFIVTLAYTCRAFLEPALNKIWSTQNEFDNLFKTLPADAWYIDGSSFTLSRPLLHSDWDRFDYYAPRIKFIRFGGDLMQWTPRILIALNLHRNLMAQDLLPNLRTLYLWGVEGSTLDRSFIFLSRTLKSITLNAPQNDIDIQNSLRALFSYLPHTCPNLEHIHMATRFPVSPLPLSIVKPLCHCTSLRTMRAAFSSFFEVEHLAVLLNLETLTTYIQDTSEVEHYYPSLPMRPVFRSLTSLTIESCSVLSFVQRCQFPVLEILSIKETSSSQEHIRLDALLNLCSPDLLRRLTLTCTRNALGVIPSYVSDIHPLLKLHGLRYFESNLKYVRGDSVLEQMAAAWPQLETLTFEQDEPCFTLSGLVPLVRCCPKLNALHIPLDAHNPQLSGYDRPGNGSSNPHISSVNFDNSLLDEVGKVAAFLSDLFPNLIDILVQSDHPQYDMWKEVERLVEYFVLVRMQERRSKQVMPA